MYARIRLWWFEHVVFPMWICIADAAIKHYTGQIEKKYTARDGSYRWVNVKDCQTQISEWRDVREQCELRLEAIRITRFLASIVNDLDEKNTPGS